MSGVLEQCLLNVSMGLVQRGVPAGLISENNRRLLFLYSQKVSQGEVEMQRRIPVRCRCLDDYFVIQWFNPSPPVREVAAISVPDGIVDLFLL